MKIIQERADDVIDTAGAILRFLVIAFAEVFEIWGRDPVLGPREVFWGQRIVKHFLLQQASARNLTK